MDNVTKKAVVGIFALFFTINGMSALTPALNAFKQAFSGIPDWMITFINTAPSITVMIGSLLAGFLLGKGVKFRPLATVGMLIYIVFGIIGYFAHESFEMILVWRIIMGLGNGIIFPLGIASTVRFFQNKDKRASILGKGQFVANIGAMCFTLLGGQLAAIDPMLSFWSYSITAIGFVVFICTYQEPPTVDEIIERNPDIDPEEFAQAKRVKLPTLVWVLLILYALHQCIRTPGLQGYSMVLAAIDGSNAAIASIGLSLFTVGAAVTALFADKWLKLLGRFTAMSFYFVVAIGLLVMAFAPNGIVCTIGLILMSTAIMINIMFNVEGAGLTTPAGVAWIGVLCGVFNNLAGFLGSYWMGALEAMWGPGNWTMFLVTAAVVIAIVGVVWLLVDRNNPMWKKD